MATISDVATRADVSTATVSRAFNGKSTVDPALAARVFRAADELDYRPNGLARSLRRQETRVLALIVSDVENPFFTAIARGVEDVAQTAGYSVLLCNADESAEKERRYIDVAVQERLAGVVLSPTGATTSVTLLAERGIPVVAVDRPLDVGRVGESRGDPVDAVLVDSRAAAREATEHLIDAGYTRVGCLTGPRGVRTANDRLAGYRDALTDADRDEAEAESELVRRAEYRAEGARTAVLDLLSGSERPDALLVANSAMAIGTLEALSVHKLRAGREIGLVAFDDVAWAALLDPPLTVIAQPSYEIGAVAARNLLARLLDPQRAPTRTVLEARLVPRASSQRDCPSST